MISLYSGTPGSGKSLHTAKDLRDRFILGKPVICNFEVSHSKYKKAVFTYVPNDELKPDYLIRYSQEYFLTHRFREGAILCVIDECQLLFNAREWQISGRAEWLSFFTQHRKYGYNIVLVAQFDRMIDRQIRSLIEYEYIHRKASNFGIGGMVLSFLSGGNLFCAVQMWYPLKARIGSELFHARKAYYSLYDSYSTFSSDSGSVPGSAGDVGPQQIPGAETNCKNKIRKRIDIVFDKIRVSLSRLSFSRKGKYLLPGGRDEQGWKKAPKGLEELSGG